MWCVCVCVCVCVLCVCVCVCVCVYKIKLITKRGNLGVRWYRGKEKNMTPGKEHAHSGLPLFAGAMGIFGRDRNN